MLVLKMFTSMSESTSTQNQYVFKGQCLLGHNLSKKLKCIIQENRKCFWSFLQPILISCKKVTAIY